MERDKQLWEKKIANAYARFAPLSKAYYHVFSRPAVSIGEVPAVLFLGNHSSGKSSLINWLLGGSPVQDTGVAPTDDGFTIIIFGETEQDVFGPAALAKLPAEYEVMQELGATFLRHLRVKIRNRDILRRVCLVDSPGMIDSAEGVVHRDYDFFGSVQRLVNLSDMVFFLFDPEKPGTTGETVETFARCLQGVEFKLRVLLNKCDTFSGLYDFARTYGTLCWNLARVLKTKDLPKIYTTYTGDRVVGRTGSLELTDVERHRAEFRAVFEDPISRRVDNVVASARSDFAQLAVRMRVINCAARKLTMLRINCILAGVILASVGAVVAMTNVAHALNAKLSDWSLGSGLSWLVGVVIVLAITFVVHLLARLFRHLYRRSLADGVQSLFEQVYRRELITGVRDDLIQDWEAVRADTAAVIGSAPLELPLFGEWKRVRVESFLKAIRAELHLKK